VSFYKVIFENPHFVVVDKKAMVLSVPGRDEKNDTRPVLGRLLEKDFNQVIYPVHRLDFEVSGLIMFARTPEAQKAGNAWFEKKEVTKTYSAITRSINEPPAFAINEEMSWKCRLLRGKKRAYESPHGKESLTRAKLVKIKGDFFYWELNPITGRSHQLRYELFRHNHPIVGDELYSSNEKFEGEGIALLAFKIDFTQAPNAKKFSLPETIEISSL
jgi:tRNA pseudouridine32 synthase / 23S rRNA pseudouridine746 synthase